MRWLWHKVFGHPPKRVMHTDDVHTFYCAGCNREFSCCSVGAYYLRFK